MKDHTHLSTEIQLHYANAETLSLERDLVAARAENARLKQDGSDIVDMLQEEQTRNLQLYKELSLCRNALGIQEGEKVPLDQTPKHGSILVDHGSTRKRISPVDDEVVRLNYALADAEREYATLALKESSAVSQRDTWHSRAMAHQQAKEFAEQTIATLEREKAGLVAKLQLIERIDSNTESENREDGLPTIAEVCEGVGQSTVEGKG